MAKAMQCDRCKRYFEKNNLTFDSIHRFEAVKVQSHLSHFKFDLCDRCATSLLKFLKMEDRIEVETDES